MTNKPDELIQNDVQRLTALSVYAKAGLAWSKRSSVPIRVQIDVLSGGGVGFEFGVGAQGSEEDGQRFLEVLQKCQRLCDLEMLFEEGRNSGVSAEYLELYRMEAESLTNDLFRPS